MLTPPAIRHHTFTIARRGFDQVEVTEFLQKVSEQVETLQAELRAAPVQADGQVSADHEIRGEQYDRVARELTMLLRSANEGAVRLRSQARADASAEAEGIVAAATANAEEIVAQAESMARDLLRKAQAQSKQLLADAEDDRVNAAGLLDSTRRSAAALTRRAEERAQAIIEEAKTADEALTSAKAAHPASGEAEPTRPRLIAVGGRDS